VPNCHVTRLVTEGGRVTLVRTAQGDLVVPDGGIVVIAAATIESARLARLSFGDVPNADLIGQNLMTHLRSNLTIRVPRTALASLPAAVKELQASALFVKGRHPQVGAPNGHFHLQITAAGLGPLDQSSDSEAELFKKIPDVDTIAAFRHANDDQIVLTIRGIGEMRPNNPATLVKLAGETDEFGMPRAFVSINPGVEDGILWNAMDTAADQVALIFANGQPYEVLSGAAFQPVAADQPASAVLAFPNRRDGLGTTHHEAGTLAMGDDPNTSVTNSDARFHRVSLHAASEIRTKA